MRTVVINLGLRGHARIRYEHRAAIEQSYAALTSACRAAGLDLGAGLQTAGDREDVELPSR